MSDVICFTGRMDMVVMVIFWGAAVEREVTAVNMLNAFCLETKLFSSF